VNHLPLFDPPPPTRERRAATLTILPPPPERAPWVPNARQDPCAHAEVCAGCADCERWRAFFVECSGCGRYQHERAMYGARCRLCQIKARGELNPETERFSWEPLTRTLAWCTLSPAMRIQLSPSASPLALHARAPIRRRDRRGGAEGEVSA